MQGTAPWVEDRPSIARRADATARVILAFLATPIFIAVGIAAQQFHLILLVTLLLVTVAFLGSGASLLARFPALGNVKLIGGVLKVTSDLDAFYRQNRPHTFLLYAFYPFYAIVGSIASADVRREVKLHARIVLVIAILMVLDAIVGYSATYPPYLSFSEALLLLGIQLVIAVLLATIYLMPMTTTVYALSLAGKRKTLRGLVIASLLVSLPIGYATYTNSSHIVPFLDMIRLTQRLESKAFRSDLGDVMEMFLSHAEQKDWIADAEKIPRIDASATKRFRKVVRGILPGVEERAFDVFAFETSKGKWTGIRVLLGSRAYPLILRSPDGKFYRRQRELPDDVAKRFSLGSTVRGSTSAYLVAMMTMLEDWKN